MHVRNKQVTNAAGRRLPARVRLLSRGIDRQIHGPRSADPPVSAAKAPLIRHWDINRPPYDGEANPWFYPHGLWRRQYLTERRSSNLQNQRSQLKPAAFSI